MADIREYAESLLTTVTGIDMNPTSSGTPPEDTNLFTVPAGKSCVITHIIFRNCTLGAALDTAQFGFGWNVNVDDVITIGVKGTNVNVQTKYRVLEVADGAVRGVAGDVLKIRVNVIQTAACYVDVDVFGYLY